MNHKSNSKTNKYTTVNSPTPPITPQYTKINRHNTTKANSTKIPTPRRKALLPTPTFKNQQTPLYRQNTNLANTNTQSTHKTLLPTPKPSQHNMTLRPLTSQQRKVLFPSPPPSKRTATTSSHKTLPVQPKRDKSKPSQKHTYASIAATPIYTTTTNTSQIITSPDTTLQNTSQNISSPTFTPQTTTPQNISPATISPTTTQQNIIPQITTSPTSTPQAITSPASTPQTSTPQISTPQISTPQTSTPQATPPHGIAPQTTNPPKQNTFTIIQHPTQSSHVELITDVYTILNNIINMSNSTSDKDNAPFLPQHIRTGIKLEIHKLNNVCTQIIEQNLHLHILLDTLKKQLQQASKQNSQPLTPPSNNNIETTNTNSNNQNLPQHSKDVQKQQQNITTQKNTTHKDIHHNRTQPSTSTHQHAKTLHKPRIIIKNLPHDINIAQVTDTIQITAPSATHKFNTRGRENTTNTIYQIDTPAHFHTLIRKKYIHINNIRYQCQEFRGIRRCFNCQMFGHLAAQCPNPPFCGHCAQPHYTKQCQNTYQQCINCYTSNTQQNTHYHTYHTAFSIACTIYRHKVHTQQENTQYA